MPALASISPPVPEPLIKVAHALACHLRADEPIDNRLVRQLFEAACSAGTTQRRTIRHAYDALELAQILLLAAPDQAPPPAPADVLADLVGFTERLPTQSVRTEEQLALQQFSTPAPIAWLLGQAAALTSDDTLLEPSAGTGMLAWPAARAGARLLLNEIDPVRRLCLAEAYPKALVTGHDGELIDDLLPSDLRPTVVIMNPPFARSEGRGSDRHAADRHLIGAAKRVPVGGRMVALMPPGSSRDVLGVTWTCRLDLMLGRGLYAKHGTGIAVRLFVWDKVVSDGDPIVAEAETLDAALPLIGRVPPRAGRGTPPFAPPASARPARASLFRSSLPHPRAAPSPRPEKIDRAARPLRVIPLDEPSPTGDPVGIYLPWRPSRIRLPDAQDHPTPLVESLAMGSIAAPRPAYAPLLATAIITGGELSAAQLETLVYAGAAFERDLPGRFRPAQEGAALEVTDDGAAYAAGFFLGDGTGAGKGRQVAGIILDQWERGRRRHIWLSKNEALLEDARRDWSALGGMALDVQPLSQWKLGTPVTLDAGILFVTYPTLRSGREDATRLQQILGWAGEDFDGVIAFDEAHALANAAGGEGSRGRVKGSEQGVAGLRLQNHLPRARILYVSATGASDVANLSYATRLGLWGPGTAFADREAFITGVRKGGIAAMELVARDLKALGVYTARALSFAGVEYDLLEHKLNPEQVQTYDAYAEAWAIIHRNLTAALEQTRVIDSVSGATLNANAKSAALSRFESVKQRFFAQLLLSAKLPSLLPSIEADLARGDAVVVQLVSTAEAMLARRLAELLPDEREALEIDLSPREYVIDYLLGAFPTRQMRVFTDAEGTTRSEPMVDDDGRPVHSQTAIAAREALVEQLCALPQIATALDAILERFGTRNVAEVTGRTRRLVSDNNGVQRLERRTPRSNLTESQSFMDGTKKLLVFSDAGGTGRSYHACLKARNQARRIHYLLEPGWRADAAIQGLGRTHRSAQASAPLFRPVTTDVRGERRFISTIARRLDTLGALTRGQRQTGGQNLFDPADNLESDHAKDALTAWYRLLYAGKLQSTTLDDFEDRSGLRLQAEGGGLREDLPPIQRWLNRLLAFPIALQNAIFDEYLGLIEARVEAARKAGTLDLGVETLAVERLTVEQDRVIRTDPASGATTHLLDLALERRPRPMLVEDVLRLAERRDACFLINHQSGRCALRLDGRSVLNEDGIACPRYEILRPLRRQRMDRDAFADTRWTITTAGIFTSAWQAEVDDLVASTSTETMHLVTGLLLPIWDALPDELAQVVRVVDDGGQSLLGRQVPTLALPELASRFGFDAAVIGSEDLVRAVLDGGRAMPVRAGQPLTLKRSLVGGSQRLELTGFEPARLPELKALGCFVEIIRYQTRLFVPVPRAAEIMAALAI